VIHSFFQGWFMSAKMR